MSQTVDARLTLRVPRNGRGDLWEATTRLLNRVTVVEHVDSFEVTDVRPGLNDLRVTVTTTVVCDVGPEATPTTALSNAVGVESVESVGTVEEGSEP